MGQGFSRLPFVALGVRLQHSIDDVSKAVGGGNLALLVGGWLMLLADGSGGNGGGTSRESSYEEASLLLESGGHLAQAVSGLDLGETDIILVAVVAALAVLSCCWLAQLALYGWIAPGFLRMQKLAIESAEPGFDTLFGKVDRFGDLVLYRVLRAFVQLVPLTVFLVPIAAFVGVGWGQTGSIEPDWEMLVAGMLLAGIPAAAIGIWLQVALVFGNHFVVFEGAGPVLALRRSLDATRGHRWAIVGYGVIWWLLTSLIAFVGLLLCLIGFLYTAPLARTWWEAAWVRAFVLARDGEAGRQSWRVVAG